MNISENFKQVLLQDGIAIINSTDEKDILPGGFRSTKVQTLPQNTQDNKFSMSGLETLHASGSSQFSEQSLDAICKRIGQKKITIVNLRQEDGGFVQPQEGKGAIAFSFLMSMPWWTGEDKRGNRTLEQIEASEETHMNHISKKRTFTLYGAADSYAPTDTHKLIYRIEIAVKRALTEKELVTSKGLGYYRLPDKKFGNMEYEHVDQFIAFVRSREPGEWLHFHCKKGQSRTTLFMIMYDMMKNADQVSALDCIRRQGPLGIGGADLDALPKTSSWDHTFKKSWREFLLYFHEYAKENKNDDFKKSWSVWASEKCIEPPPAILLKEHYQSPTVEIQFPEIPPSEAQFSENYDGSQASMPMLVLNTLNESKLRVSNFRSTQDLWLEKEPFPKEGLQKFYASGSSQPTKDGLKLLVTAIKSQHEQVVIVDLRHDDHLFVNGLNISSFETKDALLKPRTPEQILASVNELKAVIFKQPSVVAHAIDTKYPKDSFDARFALHLCPKHVEAPSELASNLGARYLLLGCKRFSEASDDDIDRFIDYWREMPKDTWYHFHCKKGKSRTTFFMTIYDMMLNANHLTMEEIVTRQHKIGGVDLFDVTPKDPTWKHEIESKKQWIQFLARFHLYAKTQQITNFKLPWTQWSKDNKEFLPNIDHLVKNNSCSL